MRSLWAQPEGTVRFLRRTVAADLAILLDLGCVVLLALHEKHSRRSREIQSDRMPEPTGVLETTVQRPTVHKAGIIRRVGLRREWPLDDRPEVDGLAGVSGLTHWRSRGYIGSDR